MVTATTPRMHFVQSHNCQVTLYAYDRESDTYADPFVLSCYAEEKRGGNPGKYAVEPDYKAMMILDGEQPYVSAVNGEQPPTGFFTIKAEDKVVFSEETATLEEVLDSDRKVFTVQSVSEFLRPGGTLMSVEVHCG